MTQFSGLFPCFSQAPGASRSQHRLSYLLLTKYGSCGCNAVGCANTNGHRPTNTKISVSAPEAVLNEAKQRSDYVQAQTHMYPILVGGFHFSPERNIPPASPKSYLQNWQDAFTHLGAASLGPQR